VTVTIAWQIAAIQTTSAQIPTTQAVDTRKHDQSTEPLLRPSSPPVVTTEPVIVAELATRPGIVRVTYLVNLFMLAHTLPIANIIWLPLTHIPLWMGLRVAFGKYLSKAGRSSSEA
jgi:hypothetical protein